MGKAKRVDLGAINQDRTNKDAQSQPRYNQGQQFFTKPGGQSSTLKIALGALRGVNIVDPTTDDALIFDGSFWIATAQSGTGSGGISLPVTMPVHDLGTVTTSAISHSFAETSAHVLKMILATPTTLTFTNIPSRHIEFELDVTQNGTGGYALNFAATSVQISNTPAVQSTASRKTVLIGQTHGLTTTSAAFDIFDTALRSAGSAGITSTAFIASWSIYPAISTVEMASFSINSLNDIFFRQGKMGIYSTTGDSMQFQTTTSGTYAFLIGDTNRLDLQTSTYQVNLATAGTAQWIINSHTNMFTTDTAWSVRMPTNSVIEILQANNLQRMTMNNTNTVFQIPTAGGFVLQTSNAATDVVSVGPNDNIFIDADVVIKDSQTFLAYENIRIASPSFLPSFTGEFRVVSDDVLVYSGLTTRNLSNIGGSSATAYVASWSVYPAITTVDMASFSIDNMTTIFGSGPNVQALKFTTSSMVLSWASYPSGLGLYENATLVAQFSNQALDMTSHNVSAVQLLSFNVGGQLAGNASDMTYNVGTGFKHILQVGGGDELYVAGATITCFSNVICSPNTLDLGATGAAWDDIWSNGVIHCDNLQDQDGDGDINVFADLDIQSGFTVDFAGTSTTATAGAISALPLFPIGYLSIKVNGTNRRVPFYAT